MGSKNMKTAEEKKHRAEIAKAYYHKNVEYRKKKALKMKEWASKNKDKIKEYQKNNPEYEITPERRKQKNEAQARYRKKKRILGTYTEHRGDRTAQTRRWLAKPGNILKKRAHIKVYEAIKIGKLFKKPCEKCGQKAVAHHDDYSKPLVVRWLCQYHHYEHHKTNP